MYLSHLFIHSSVHGQLGWFHLLAIANDTAMNVGAQVSDALFSILFGIYLGVGFLDPMVFFFF